MQVMHLKGENDRVREQLRLAQKSAATRQTQMSDLHRQLDQLQGKTKTSPRPSSLLVAGPDPNEASA